MPLEIQDLIASTAHNRTSEIQDAVTNHSPLFYMLKKKKKIVKGDFSGSSVYEPITYSGLNKTDDGTLHDAGFYKDYANFDVTLGAKTLTASEWEGAELGAVISISNRETWQNVGIDRKVDWANQKIENMKMELQNLMSTSVYSNGTAYGGNEFDGLGAIVSATPAVGTIGGIDRATESWWRNQYINPDITSVSLISQMDVMDLLTMRGSQKCDLILAGKNMFLQYQSELQAYRRIHSSSLGDIGFKSLEYNGTPVIYDANCAADKMYFINTDTFKFRHPKGWFFKTEKSQQVPGATYHYIPCYVAGNFTCSDLARNGLIEAA